MNGCEKVDFWQSIWTFFLDKFNTFVYTGPLKFVFAAICVRGQLIQIVFLLND